MDEYTFANRGAAIPIFNFPSADASSDDSASERGGPASSAVGEEGEKQKHSPSLQDRLFAKILQQVIPSDGDVNEPQSPRRSSRKYLHRPGFSLPLMTSNFRRFNARIGVVFVIQAQIIRLLTWETASHTLSLLAAYSFICLNPHVLAALPPVVLLLFVFVPAFLARHPPPPLPPSSHSANNSAALASPRFDAMTGPALAPPRVIKPASETSRDFFRNMRDLQNAMADFSTLHDLVIETFTPWTNFSHEERSSALFVFLAVLAFIAYFAAPVLPWRAIFLSTGWILVGLCHPTVSERAARHFRLYLRPRWAAALGNIEQWVAADVRLDEAPEILETEIFELQRRRGSDMSASRGRSSEGTEDSREDLGVSEWEGWLFSPSPWEPMAPARVAGERPRGTRFFEDVRPPPGWEWEGKKWVLDLASRDWVEMRLLAGLEVEVEGERWVYDHMRSNIHRDATDDDPTSTEMQGDRGLRGEWRRRRWIRNVRRSKIQKPQAGKLTAKTG